MRPPEPHELDEFASCVEAAFLFRYPADERERFLAALDPARCLVAERDGTLVGTVASHLVELTLPGPTVARVAALTDVGVLPTARGRGIGRELITRFLADTHRRREPLVLLDAGAPGLYRRLGFAPASWSARYRVAPGRASLLEPARSSDLFLLRPHEAEAALPEVFDRHRRRSPGEITRTPERWRELLEDDKDVRGRAFVLAHGPGGVLDGYARYRRTDGAVLLDELVATTVTGYRAMYSVLFALDRGATFETGPRPVDEPARFLLADPGALETLEVRDASWMRIVDLRRALELRRYRAAEALTLAVKDPVCEWNNATVTLAADARGRATVSAGAAEADLSLSIGALAAAYLGATPFETLVAGGEAAELTPGAAQRADLLFGRGRRPFRGAEL